MVPFAFLLMLGGGEDVDFTQTPCWSIESHQQSNDVISLCGLAQHHVYPITEVVFNSNVTLKMEEGKLHCVPFSPRIAKFDYSVVQKEAVSSKMEELRAGKINHFIALHEEKDGSKYTHDLYVRRTTDGGNVEFVKRPFVPYREGLMNNVAGLFEDVFAFIDDTVRYTPATSIA